MRQNMLISSMPTSNKFELGQAAHFNHLRSKKQDLSENVRCLHPSGVPKNKEEDVVWRPPSFSAFCAFEEDAGSETVSFHVSSGMKYTWQVVVECTSSSNRVSKQYTTWEQLRRREYLEQQLCCNTLSGDSCLATPCLETVVLQHPAWIAVRAHREAIKILTTAETRGGWVGVPPSFTQRGGHHKKRSWTFFRRRRKRRRTILHTPATQSLVTHVCGEHIA